MMIEGIEGIDFGQWFLEKNYGLVIFILKIGWYRIFDYKLPIYLFWFWVRFEIEANYKNLI